MDPVTGTHYTLTGAADWPMLATVGGLFMLIMQAVVIALISTIYRALPKHADLQRQRDQINLDIKELATSFEQVLEKHILREQAARESKDDAMQSAFERQRRDCQARYEGQFNELFRQMREGAGKAQGP